MTDYPWMVAKRLTRDEYLDRIESLASKNERQVGEAFLRAVRGIRDLATLEQVADALESGGETALLQLFDSPDVSNELQVLSAAIGGAVMDGGRIAAETQPAVTGPRGGRVSFVFNQANPRLASFAERQTTQRVREITEDVRGVVRDVVRDEALAGRNPRDTARRIRESIGLTRRQERAVANYRRLLENGDRAALERALRDRRFDSSVRRAVSGDRALSDDQIDRMVGRYRERYLRYRSETIARTETIRALSGANQEFLQGYIDSGEIDERQVRRFWHYTFDERTRAEHRQIPAMNPDGVGMNEPFQTPLGPLMFPGDPMGAVSNVANCRCSVYQRVISAELIGLTPEGAAA